MGRTVPSYRIVIESEIKRWSGFAKVLCKEEREAFEVLMDMCRSNAMAGGNACNPVLFEPMVMSILLSQQKKVQKLEYELSDLIWKKVCSAKQPEPLITEKIDSSNNSERQEVEKIG
jgi:hypothetical protein